MSVIPTLQKRVVWSIAALAAMGLSGCAQLREGTDTIADDFSGLTKSVRKPDAGTGVRLWSDSRSSEIERNLGVR